MCIYMCVCVYMSVGAWVYENVYICSCVKEMKQLRKMVMMKKSKRNWSTIHVYLSFIEKDIDLEALFSNAELNHK